MKVLNTRILLGIFVVLLGASCLSDETEPIAEGEDTSVDVTQDRPQEDGPSAPQDEVDEEPEPLDPVDEPVDPVVDPEPEPVEPEPEVVPCLPEDNCIGAFPAKIVATTEGGTRDVDRYACQPNTDESGPERLYKVVLPHAGFLAVEVMFEGVGVDVDVHLLLENDPQTCMDRGNYAAGAYLEAGTYWLVADTWVNSEGTEFPGQFELSVNLTRPEDLEALGINALAAVDALKAFSTSWQRSETRRFEYAITDFSLHSSLRRQWIVQLATGELLYRLHVGHGVASVVGDDLGMASVFSNIPESHQSSLGLVRTAETYFGDYGYSLRIDGLEPDFNSNVRDRAIVVHPWYGNRAETIAAEGWVVPTWGCPTVDPEVSAEVIDTISDGALMFFWYPDPTYRGASTYL